MNAMNSTHATEQSIAAAREMYKQWKASDDQRDSGLSADVAGVRRFSDIVYGPAGAPWNTLDVSVPEQYLAEGAAAPVIIHIHGGGWFYGTKHTYEFWAARMAQLGFAVVNFSYRLPPEVEFPGELDDVSRAISWVGENAEKYHLDASNAFLIGDSAGGQMMLQYMTAITNADFNTHFNNHRGYPQPHLTIRALISDCGGTFLDQQLPTGKTDPFSLVQQSYFTDEAVAADRERFLTEKYMTTALPPILLVTGNADFIHDNSVRLDGYLLAKGIEHEFRSYGTPDNPQQHVFMYNMKNPVGEQCRQDEAAFLRAHSVH